MADVTVGPDVVAPVAHKPRFDGKTHPATVIVFLLLLVGGIGYAAYTNLRGL
jgi:hypothetical protein